ncbi:MAG: PAS domain-containing protein, partial [Roseiflexaceae bacterium]|nr:PAS domain-containing protein [Roseiflexaceae bacterium]
ASIELVCFLIWRQDVFGIAVLITLFYAICLWIAQVQLSKAAISGAVTTLGGGLLGVAIAVVIVWPSLFPALAVLPVLAIAIALPYISGYVFRSLCVAGFLVSLLVILLGQFLPAPLISPWWLTPAIQTSTLSATVLLITLLLWQFSRRLTDTMLQIQSSHAALVAAQHALAVHHDRLIVTIQNIGDGVITTSADGHVTLMNTVAEQLTGWNDSEAYNRVASDVFQLQSIGPTGDQLNPVQEVLTTRRAIIATDDLMLINRAGTSYCVTVHASPLLNSDQVVDGVVLVLHDVTARRRAEEDQREWDRRLFHTQKLESLGVLAGGIAHDFNNLLTVVLGNATLALLELPDAAPARLSLQSIEHAARHAADLTRQMLAYSGKGQFFVQQIDLNAVVTDMTPLLRAGMAKTAVLQLQLAPSLPAIEADVAQVRQIVMNLVVNAAEALGEQPGLITVRTDVRLVSREELSQATVVNDLPAGRYIVLAVRDTGSGIDAEAQASIFEPFYTTKAPGRGLGLAAVQGIVRGHGGALSACSTLGQGSTFTVMLPVVATPAILPIAVPAAHAPPRA